MHETSGLVRLQYLLAFLLGVTWYFQFGKGHGHESGTNTEFTEVDQDTTDIGKGFLCERFTVLLSGLPDQLLIVVERQIGEPFFLQDREKIDPTNGFRVRIVLRTGQSIYLNKVAIPCSSERLDG